MFWTAVIGRVSKSTNPAPELAVAFPANGATRRPSTRTSVAPGSNPRSAREAVPTGPPWLVPLLPVGPEFEFAIGWLLSSCSTVVPCPDLLIKSRLRLNTGFGPTSSEVGMLEPVTMTRSASACAPAAAPAPAAAGAPAPGPVGGAPTFCAIALVAMMKGNPTPATKAARINPTLLSTFLVIGFSLALVRLRLHLLVQLLLFDTKLPSHHLSSEDINPTFTDLKRAAISTTFVS